MKLAARRLAALPPALPRGARALDASRNVIAVLPRDLSALRNLRSLDLSNNGLRVLPVRRRNRGSSSARQRCRSSAGHALTRARRAAPQAAIGQLVLLEQLNLQHNALTELPAEIGARAAGAHAHARALAAPSLMRLPARARAPQAGCASCTRWACAATSWRRCRRRSATAARW